MEKSKANKNPFALLSEEHLKLLAIALSIVLLAGTLLLQYTVNLSGGLTLLFYILAFLPVGIPVIKESVEEGLKGDPFSEFTLMSIACIGAFCMGEFTEAVAVMLLCTIGEYFQDKAVEKAHATIKALLDICPRGATVKLKEGGYKVVNPADVAVGEIVSVKPGERVPLDGILLSRDVMLNTSALTGESTPLHLSEGEEVLAGSIVTDKLIEIKVSRGEQESAVSKILRLVEEAEKRKAPTELFIRKFSKVYTPIMIAIAVAVIVVPFLIAPSSYNFSEWFYKALTLLLISCPCALVISVPLSYFSGIGVGAKYGILFKGGNYIDELAKVKAVFLDKTGTLTKGVFEVTEITPDINSEITPKELLALVAAAERSSTHPIAKAVVKRATLEGIDLPKVEEAEEIAGEGVKALLATHDGSSCFIAGNTTLMKSFGVAFPTELEQTVHTTVLCATKKNDRSDYHYLGSLILADSPKEEAEEAIVELRKTGVQKISILSGDKSAIVAELSKKLGVTEFYGELMPEEKLRILSCESLKTAFVGDGINDAPVLTAADVGIAMGALGSDAAIESADIVIQTDNLRHIPTAIKIARKTKDIVKQNIFFSIGIKLVILIICVTLFASLWAAVFADTAVALLAILNSLKIRFVKF